MSKHAPPGISSSGARVVASGTVIPFQEPGEVAFEIGPANDRLAVILRFEDGPGEPPIDVKRASARLVRIVVRGSAAADGGGTTRPLTLDALEGLKLWAHLRVSRAGGSVIPVFYAANNPRDHVVACASLFEAD